MTAAASVPGRSARSAGVWRARPPPRQGPPTMIPVPAFTDVNVLDPSVRGLVMLTEYFDAALPPLTSLLPESYLP